MLGLVEFFVFVALIMDSLSQSYNRMEQYYNSTGQSPVYTTLLDTASPKGSGSRYMVSASALGRLNGMMACLPGGGSSGHDTLNPTGPSTPSPPEASLDHPALSLQRSVPPGFPVTPPHTIDGILGKGARQEQRFLANNEARPSQVRNSLPASPTTNGAKSKYEFPSSFQE